MTVILIVLIIICLCMEAFFSSSEIALISVNRARLREKINRNDGKARRIGKILQHPDLLLGTTLLGTNFSTVCASTLATLLVTRNLGPQYDYLAIVIMSPMILIFAEILPKTVAQAKANSYAEVVVTPLMLAQKIMLPFVWVLARLSKVMTGFIRFTTIKKNPLLSREDLEFSLREMGRGQGLKKIERQMINRIFEFKKTNVEDAMIPLIEVVASEASKGKAEVLNLARTKGVSRIPIYKNRIDNIVGIVNVLDLLFDDSDIDEVLDLAKPCIYVPESKPVDVLLSELNEKGSKMAIVVDEYGGAIGLVTAEDILEEIVGDIEDEYDLRRKYVKRKSQDVFLVDGRLELEQLRTLLPGLEIADEVEFETVAGLILDRLKSIPRVGQVIEVSGWRFTVAKASKRRVEQVKIEKTN